MRCVQREVAAQQHELRLTAAIGLVCARLPQVVVAVDAHNRCGRDLLAQLAQQQQFLVGAVASDRCVANIPLGMRGLQAPGEALLERNAPTKRIRVAEHEDARSLRVVGPLRASKPAAMNCNLDVELVGAVACSRVRAVGPTKRGIEPHICHVGRGPEPSGAESPVGNLTQHRGHARADGHREHTEPNPTVG